MYLPKSSFPLGVRNDHFATTTDRERYRDVDCNGRGLDRGFHAAILRIGGGAQVLHQAGKTLDPQSDVGAAF